MHRHTKDGGLGVHQIVYEKMGLPLYLLALWASSRATGKDHEAVEEHFWNMPKEEREKALHTNQSSLDRQDLVISGFEVKEDSVENGELNIIVEK